MSSCPLIVALLQASFVIGNEEVKADRLIARKYWWRVLVLWCYPVAECCWHVHCTVVVGYKCTMHHVSPYEDFYKHFGHSLQVDKDLINDFAYLKILEMAQYLMSCQALIHPHTTSAWTLIVVTLLYVFNLVLCNLHCIYIFIKEKHHKRKLQRAKTIFGTSRSRMQQPNTIAQRQVLIRVSALV